jgi:hypothetical protein
VHALDGLGMRDSDSAEAEGASAACTVKFSLICPPATKIAPIMREATPKIDIVMNIGMLAVPL